MKRSTKKSLYKIFVSLFVVFYTFLPQSIVIGQVIDEISQENTVPTEEVIIPEESLLQEEVVLEEEEELPPVVEEPLVEEVPIEEPVVNKLVIEPEEVIKEALPIPLWDINGDSATTYDVVKLGETYIAPQNSRVRIIFTKLPENPSTISIEEITLTQEEIEATGAVSDMAYDIKTDMLDGTFEYDLTLPNIEENTKVVYVEERVDLFTDVKEVTNEIISDSEDTIKIKELDHFTIFFVSATVKISGEVNGSSQVTVTPGGTITVTLEVELSGDEPNDWYSTQYKIGDYSSVCLNNVPDPDINNTGSHTVSFDLSAPTTTGTYDLRLRIYDRSNCDYTNDSNRKEITLPSAIVVANLPPVTNPSLNQACGLDIAIVIDNSTSIDSSEMNQIKNAMTSFTNALNGTPTWFSVTRFATIASVVQTFTSDTSAVNAAINAIPVGGGYTNWQDGLTKALSTFSSDRNDIPDLIIFASDGNPNRTGTTGISVNEAQAVADAVVVANQIKGLNIRILTLGVGADLDTPNLVQISGSNVNTGDVLTSDVITTSFTELAAQLYTFASQTCGGTISVNKYYDQVAEASRGGAGWVFDVAGTTRTSDANGQTETVKVDAGIYSVSETNLLPGYSYGSASCYKVASPSHIEIGVDVSNGVGSIPVGNTDIVYCNFINTTNPGSITIIKDAQPNDSQDFSFTTTGTGLTNFTLDDDSDPTLSDTKVFSNLMPGTFTIIEDDISDWSLDSITCSTGGVVDLVNKKATVTLTAGLDVTCTFTNKIKTGHIIIEKQTDPDGSTKSFEFNPSWSDTNFFLIDGQNIDSGALLPGTYSISELEPLGWDSTSSCDDGSTVDNISLQAGEIIKCTFTNIDLIPTILVTKVANPTVVPETGGNVTFTFRVENTSSEEPVTILSLSDTVYTLSGDADCMVGTVLAAGASCEFSITEWVEGDYSGLDHRNVFTGKAKDNDNTEATDTDDATVDFTNVVPTIEVTKTPSVDEVPETGGNVTFTFTVKNTSSEEPVTITSLSDSVYGTLAGDADCNVDTVLAAGATCEFSITKWVEGDYSGGDHYNKFTAVAEDNDGTDASDDDDATVDFSDVAPAIEVTKTADTLVLPVPGGNVEFTVVVTNNSQESVTLTTLTDDIYGDLDGSGTCATGGIITANGGTYLCAFTGAVNGAPDLYTDIVTAIATDNDGTSDTDTDDAVVELEGGKIIVEKLTTLPDQSQQSFEFDSSWGDNFFLINDQSIDSGWLAPGSYSIVEITTPGWELINTSCISSIKDSETAESLELDAGETITCTFTNTRDTGSLTVYKVIDEDGDLTTTDDQTMGIDWEFDVDGVSDDTSNPSLSTTDFPDGKIVFSELKTGTYEVKESAELGYEIVGATCGVNNGSLDGYTMYSVDVSKDSNTICTFYNTPNGVVHGYKWNDIDMDGLTDEEPLLSGWTINLYKGNEEGFDETPLKSMDTDDTETHFGWYWFDHLFPGTYKVCEVQKEGWNQSYPINEDDNCHIIQLPEKPSDRDQSTNFVVGLEYNFGNYAIPSQLKITKDNDSPIDGLLTGSTVLYTIIVTAPSNEEKGTYLINNIKVTDILPKGFEYMPGTWTANSSVRGNIKGSITTEPEYNKGLATWILGDMKEGEIVTLTYTAKINLLNEPGTYKDIAFVQGDSLLAEKDSGDVLGISYDPSEYLHTDTLGDNFVGTKVLVIEPMEEGGEVLGASTTLTLPKTGAETYITLGAIISMILGILLFVFGKKRKLNTILLSTVLLFGIFTLVKPVQTYAQVPGTKVSVRLEQPKTGLTDREFNITYVALSIPVKPITVQCQYSLDGVNFSNFDISKTTNSGDCKVDQSIVTGSGTYYFRAIASTTDGGAESEVITVKVADKPSPVTEYSKAKAVCTYTLKFKSSTSKVQIFRSDNQKSFYADDTTLITKPYLTVTPNVLSTYTDTPADCSKEYYYAVRAVDEYSNVSALVTDNVVTVVEQTQTSTSQESEEVAGEETTTQQEQETTSTGEVAGEETTAQQEEKAETDTKDETKTEEKETEESIWDKYKYLIISVIVVALGSGIYDYIRRKK